MSSPPPPSKRARTSSPQSSAFTSTSPTSTTAFVTRPLRLLDLSDDILVRILRHSYPSPTRFAVPRTWPPRPAVLAVDYALSATCSRFLRLFRQCAVSAISSNGNSGRCFSSRDFAAFLRGFSAVRKVCLAGISLYPEAGGVGNDVRGLELKHVECANIGCGSGSRGGGGNVSAASERMALLEQTAVLFPSLKKLQLCLRADNSAQKFNFTCLVSSWRDSLEELEIGLIDCFYGSGLRISGLCSLSALRVLKVQALVVDLTQISFVPNLEELHVVGFHLHEGEHALRVADSVPSKLRVFALGLTAGGDLSNIPLVLPTCVKELALIETKLDPEDFKSTTHCNLLSDAPRRAKRATPKESAASVVESWRTLTSLSSLRADGELVRWDCILPICESLIDFTLSNVALGDIKVAIAIRRFRGLKRLSFRNVDVGEEVASSAMTMMPWLEKLEMLDVDLDGVGVRRICNILCLSKGAFREKGSLLRCVELSLRNLGSDDEDACCHAAHLSRILCEALGFGTAGSRVVCRVDHLRALPDAD